VEVRIHLRECELHVLAPLSFGIQPQASIGHGAEWAPGPGLDVVGIESTASTLMEPGLTTASLLLYRPGISRYTVRVAGI
jgi:hypothetical protein